MIPVTTPTGRDILINFTGKTMNVRFIDFAAPVSEQEMDAISRWLISEGFDLWRISVKD